MKIRQIFAATLIVGLSSTAAVAQTPVDPMTPGMPPADAPIDTPGTMPPSDTMPPQPEVVPQPEATPPDVTPDSSPDSLAPVPVGGADGPQKNLIACGPNGAAFVTDDVPPGCHLLKANEPPLQAGNGAADAEL